MRGKDFLEKLNLVDSKFVEEADRAKKKKAPLRGWLTGAACVSLAAIVGVLAWRMQDIPNPPVSGETDLTIATDAVPETEEPVPETTLATEVPGNTVIGGISRHYKDVPISSTEIAIEWGWDMKTLTEKFTELTVNGTEYTSSGMNVGVSLLGESLGTYELVGYDWQTETEHRLEAEVFPITGVKEDSMLAAQLDGKYVIFKNRTYNPPATFGELLKDYSLAENLPFHRFSARAGHTDTGYFSLEDDWYIWQILEECTDAAYVDADIFHKNEGEYLSFTATSEALGAYKKVFYVTADGYAKTNVFEYGYSYYIGEEAAGKILAYAKENSTPASPEPYTNSLAGTLTEITDEYLIVDDTILCTYSEDGLSFRIPATDLRIRRSMTGIDVGDVIVVNFKGDIDVAGGNVVTGAYGITKGYILDGDVVVPE